MSLTVAPRARYGNAEASFSVRTKAGPGDCILWTGTVAGGGYGVIQRDGKKVPAHRFAWERANGPIPYGMQVDHMCWNPACVNVEHLRLVTLAQNAQNRKGANSNSKSGVRGVTFDKGVGKWRAQIQFNGVSRYGGVYPTLAEAEEAVIRLRRKFFTHSIK